MDVDDARLLEVIRKIVPKKADALGLKELHERVSAKLDIDLPTMHGALTTFVAQGRMEEGRDGYWVRRG